MRTYTRTPLADRFWASVQKTDGCWLWTLSPRNGYGYGALGLGGRGAKIELAHRVSWMLNRGPIPDGMLVLHRCDNPRCVNPDHLFLGTQADNMRDCRNKGRLNHANKARGDRTSRSKLTAEQVIEMRALWDSGEVILRQLAERYGVTIQSVWAVVHRKSWSHI